MEQFDDLQLTEALKQGDPDAFATIYDRYERQVKNVIRKFINNRNDVEDIEQEVFLKLWQNREKQAIINLRAYLLKSAMYQCSNHFNKSEAMNKRHHAYEQFMNGKRSDQKIKKQQLKIFFNRLDKEAPKEAVDIFQGVYLDRKKHKEVAEDLGITEARVAYTVKKWIEKLRKNDTKQ